MRQPFRTTVCALAIAVAGSAATPLLAAGIPYQQQHDQYRQDNRDQNRDRDNDHNDNAYANNRYYQSGWKDGQHHKRKNVHFKNDTDRQAYEAGFGHGDRGERWQNHKKKDHDRENH